MHLHFQFLVYIILHGPIPVPQYPFKSLSWRLLPPSNPLRFQMQSSAGWPNLCWLFLPITQWSSTGLDIQPRLLFYVETPVLGPIFPLVAEMSLEDPIKDTSFLLNLREHQTSTSHLRNQTAATESSLSVNVKMQLQCSGSPADRKLNGNLLLVPHFPWFIQQHNW